MKSKLRILHVEDSEPDSELIHQMLVREGIECEIVRRDTKDEYIEDLKTRDFDLIFADCALPGFSGQHALELAREYAPEIPFIFVSGSIGEESAIESLHNGATDYVLKERLSRLVPAVTRAVEEHHEKEKNLEMEQRLRQAQQLEAVGTLAGGIAHDFNNILTIIRGYSSLLANESEATGRVNEIAGTIDQAARRGADLVNQLLAFARKSDGTFTATKVNQLIRSLAVMLRETMSRNILFEFQLDDTLPEILADAGQIERVIINLVTNARDAMPSGGKIIFATSRIHGTQGVACLADAPNQDYLLLRVIDSGTGMNEDTRQHVFEPFFTTKPTGKGTGLGMPVAYGLMQSHHGAIDVFSELGKGTAVSLFFPILGEHHRQPTTRIPDVTKPSRGTETLLIVDDEEDVVGFLRLMLEAQGYRVLSAGSAEEAIEIFMQHRDEIDLLFSDVGLPSLDGFGLGHRLQELNPDLKIILASGYADRVREHALESDIEDFVSKPYSSDSILATIRTVLDNTEKPTPTHDKIGI